MPEESVNVEEKNLGLKFQDNLRDSIAQICWFAQGHWFDNKEDMSYDHMTTVSHVVACMLAQNTVYGNDGVDSNVVIEELVDDIKEFGEWQYIIQRKIDNLGGEK